MIDEGCGLAARANEGQLPRRLRSFRQRKSITDTVYPLRASLLDVFFPQKRQQTFYQCGIKWQIACYCIREHIEIQTIRRDDPKILVASDWCDIRLLVF